MFNKRLAKVGLVVCVLVLVVMVGVVSAQGEAPGGDGAAVSVPGLRDLVLLLATAAGGGLVASFLAERQAWFQRLPPDVKAVVFPLITILIPVLAQLILNFVPTTAWPVIEQYWTPLAGGLLACGVGTTAYHAIIKPQQQTAKQMQRLMARPISAPQESKK